MKATKVKVPAIVAWSGVILLVIASLLSVPAPGWLIVPAWLLFGAGISVQISQAPNHSPYKQAFGMTLLALVFMLSYLFEPVSTGPVFVLLTEPSLGHLFIPRPFHVLAIVYLSSLCVFLNIKIQDLQRDVANRKKEYADLRDTLALEKGRNGPEEK